MSSWESGAFFVSFSASHSYKSRAGDLSNRRILDIFPGETIWHLHALIFVYNAVLNKLFTSPLVLLECPAFGSLEQEVDFSEFWEVIFCRKFKLPFADLARGVCPKTTYGHISRVIHNLSLKFKLRHWAAPKCQIWIDGRPKMTSLQKTKKRL